MTFTELAALHAGFTPEETTELTAFLAVQVAKQDADDSIVAALEHHLMGRRLAVAVQREREEKARLDAHYGRLVARTKCLDCLSLNGESFCDVHNINAEYL